MLNDFIKILKKIEILYVLDIYSAGEKPIKNITSINMVKKLRFFNKNIYHLGKNNNIKKILKQYYNDDNIIVFMGAGSVTYMANDLFKISGKFN